jgi:hypothetical protein
VERVVQFETKRKTSPGFDIPTSYSDESRKIRKKVGTGAAWLSSARAVRCSLKWGNERNPHPMLNYSLGTVPDFSGEEGGEDVKSARPLYPGLHTHYNGEEQWAAST